MTATGMPVSRRASQASVWPPSMTSGEVGRRGTRTGGAAERPPHRRRPQRAPRAARRQQTHPAASPARACRTDGRAPPSARPSRACVGSRRGTSPSASRVRPRRSRRGGGWSRASPGAWAGGARRRGPRTPVWRCRRPATCSPPAFMAAAKPGGAGRPARTGVGRAPGTVRQVGRKADHAVGSSTVGAARRPAVARPQGTCPRAGRCARWMPSVRSWTLPPVKPSVSTRRVARTVAAPASDTARP